MMPAGDTIIVDSTRGFPAAAPFINGTRGAIYRRERANSRERADRDLRRIYALRNNSSAFTD
jgi:hypothetical protein